MRQRRSAEGKPRRRTDTNLFDLNTWESDAARQRMEAAMRRGEVRKRIIAAVKANYNLQFQRGQLSKSALPVLLDAADCQLDLSGTDAPFGEWSEHLGKYMHLSEGTMRLGLWLRLPRRGVDTVRDRRREGRNRPEAHVLGHAQAGLGPKLPALWRSRGPGFSRLSRARDP